MQVLYIEMSSSSWCQHGLAISVEGPQGAWSTTVERPFARISAQNGAEVVLPDPRVGSRGIYLHATDAGVYAVGFSHAETGEKPWRGWLEPEQWLTIGPYRISARSPGLEGPPDATVFRGLDLDQKGSSPSPYPILSVCFHDRETARRKLSRQLTIVGRLRPSALPIQSNDLSASHLALYWDGKRLWAIDLLSRMGVRKDRVPIQCAELPLGASLAIGEVTLIYTGLFNPQDSLDASGVLSRQLADEPANDWPDPTTPSADLEAQRQWIERWRDELDRREFALEQEQERLLAQFKQRESEWRQRMAELNERQANFSAEQQRLQNVLAEERRKLRAKIREQAASAGRTEVDLQRLQLLETQVSEQAKLIDCLRAELAAIRSGNGTDTGQTIAKESPSSS